MSLFEQLAPLPEIPEIIIPTVDITLGVAPFAEEEEEEVQAWLEIAEWVSGWLVDNVLRPGTEWFIGLIEWILAEIKVLKHNLLLLLAEIYETDLGFLFLTVGTIVLSVYLPQLITLIKESAIGATILKIHEWIKGGVGRILELTAFVDLVAISNILAVIWPTWRELTTKLSEAVSALAEELGEGTGYIHAWVSTVHGLILTSNALLGIDPQVSSIEALEKTEEFTRNASENFRRYAHDPGLIVTDIIEKYYIPYATRVKDGQQGIIESVRENRDRTLDLYTTLRDFQGRLDHFIAIQPDETAAIVDEKLGPITEALDSFLDDFQLEVLPRIEGTLSVLEQRADWIEAANARVAEKVDDPLYTLAMYDLMSPAEQALFNRGVILIAAAGEQEMDIQPLDEFLPTIGRAVERFKQVPIDVPAIDSVVYEPPGFPLMAETAEQRTRDWFVGEY